MKRMLISALGAVLLVLPACVTPVPLPDPDRPAASAVEVVGDKVVLEGYRALTLAEIGYNSVASATLAATKAGLITGPRATVARDLNRKATAALEMGHKAATGAEKARAAATVLSSIAGLCDLGLPDRVCAPFRRR